MAEDRILSYGQPLPASWLAALQEFLGSAALNFHLTLVPSLDNFGDEMPSTAVQVVAAPLSGQVALGIDGLFRYISGTINAAVTGTLGLYDVFAVTGPNSFASTPTPDTDNTNYAFALQVLRRGTTPTLTGSITNFRKVGDLDWDGSSITSLRDQVGDRSATQPIVPTSAASNQAAVRAMVGPGHTGSIQTWESGGSTVASVDATGAVITQTQTTSDSSTKAATTQFVHNVKRVTRETHSFTFPDNFLPDPTVTQMGSFAISPAAGETVTLVGVMIQCTLYGSTPSVFKIQYDHGSHGSLYDVPGLTGLTPATGAMVLVSATGGPLALAALDRIALVITTAGNSQGCTLVVVTEHTA